MKGRILSRENRPAPLPAARRGECYAFQICLETAHESGRITISFSDLRSDTGAVIPASALHVLNLAGTDYLGKPIRFDCSIEAGSEKTLWGYLQLPADVEAGCYHGTVTVGGDGLTTPDTTFSWELAVSEEVAENAGVNDPANLSRIKWFDSDLYQDATVPAPFTPVRADGRSISILGRNLVLNELGLPKQISTFYDQSNLLCDEETTLLEDEFRFVAVMYGAVEHFKNVSFIAQEQEDCFSFISESRSANLALHHQGRVEFDGFCAFDLCVEALETVELDDIRLEIPFAQDRARYFVGLGHQGGCLPDEVSFQWDSARHQDSFWLGDVNAGARVQFMDEEYVKPNVNIYYAYKPLRVPKSWGNGGAGGIRADKNLVTAYSGSRTLQKGEKLHYIFHMMITPLKPIDYKLHFSSRYYHTRRCVSCADWLEKLGENGANILNVHHGGEANPFINYPFLEAGTLKSLVDDAHDMDVKVKLYYTVRELTTKICEYPIIRSLDYEILEPSRGIENMTFWQDEAKEWISKNFGDDIIPAWKETITKGKYAGQVDASLLTNGQSRLCNYYIEGLDWLVKNVGIDGLYIDDVAYDRDTMKRVRKTLDQKEGCLIDIHTWNHFTQSAGMTNSLNLYTELLPYINELWLGESFDYDHTTPDYWLVEMSGIPYGLMAEMLEGGGNFYRGLLFGETARHGWSQAPDVTPVWRLWDEFGISDSQMYGYWDGRAPVRADCGGIYVTSYVKKNCALIAVASWADEDASVRLVIDPDRLGFTPGGMVAPAIGKWQGREEFSLDSAIPVAKCAGKVLLLN